MPVVVRTGSQAVVCISGKDANSTTRLDWVFFIGSLLLARLPQGRDRLDQARGPRSGTCTCAPRSCARCRGGSSSADLGSASRNSCLASSCARPTAAPPSEEPGLSPKGRERAGEGGARRWMGGAGAGFRSVCRVLGWAQQAGEGGEAGDGA